jgi:hypothetical protein
MPVSALNVDARATFIWRTYLHLLGSILAFTGIECVLFSTGMAESIAISMLQLPWLVILGVFMVVSWIASHMAHRAESAAAQYMALGVFITAEALIFVPLLFMAERMAGGGVITSAAGVTVIAFVGLTMVAFITRKDFSFLRGVLFYAMILALVAIVGGAIFGFQLGTYFSVVMVGVAGAAILYDTSNIIHHYPEDRYVGAALALFASVALMFWYVLRLFMASDD